MDREKALQHLGLYVGATPEHVSAKFARLELSLQTAVDAENDPAQKRELQQRLTNARAAHTFLLTGSNALTPAATQPEWIPPTDVQRPVTLTGVSALPGAPAAPGRRLWRGWILLLLVLSAMAAYVVINFSGMAWLDSDREDRGLQRQRADAAEARDKWQAYRAKAGIAESSDAERANESFLRAEQDQTRGFPKEAGTGFSAALQGYMNSFRAEEARIKDALARDVTGVLKAMQGQFPFSANSAEDADPTKLAAVLHPLSGAIWRIEKEWSVLAEVKVAGLLAATEPPELKPALARCARLRDALFQDPAQPLPNCIIGARIADNALFAHMGLEIAGTAISPRAQVPFTPVQCIGGYPARLTISMGRDGMFDFDYRNQSWGLLRLLGRMEFAGESDGVFTWQFDLEQLSDGKPRKRDGRTARLATLSIQANPGKNPFAPGAFAE